MKLFGKLGTRRAGEPLILRVVEDAGIPSSIKPDHALVLDSLTGLSGDVLGGFGGVLVRHGAEAANCAFPLPKELNYLQTNDIVRINPSQGEIRVLYRRASSNNSLFFTERCNSRCLMCSQPPKDIDDAYRIAEMIKTVRLMDKRTTRLGITGGEPTLDPEAFLSVLKAIKDYLPETAVYCLTNGRQFRFEPFVGEIAKITGNQTIFCVPLYSAVDSVHDYIVQARGAYEETIRGLLNCARHGLRIEVRVVITRANYQSLPSLAEFTTRNLPFVEHVALMGLEITGFTRANLDALWIDPIDYGSELQATITKLREGRIAVSIYNHPLCVLPRGLWGFAKKSISDWKNMYVRDECSQCSCISSCGGLFESAQLKMSRGIRAISAERLENVQWMEA